MNTDMTKMLIMQCCLLVGFVFGCALLGSALTDPNAEPRIQKPTTSSLTRNRASLDGRQFLGGYFARTESTLGSR
jgi:hypothetical protein